MTYDEWKALCRRVNDMADRIYAMKLARIKAEAVAAGISPDGCCIHNASIDDNLSGWCYRNPARLKAAKRLKREWNDFEASQVAERIIKRAWARVKLARS